MTKLAVLCVYIVSFFLAHQAFAVQDYALALFRPISASECIYKDRLRAQYDSFPANQTHINVRHMGDPFTKEWIGQISNAPTWDAQIYTGLAVPWPHHVYQAGFYDSGPPIGTNVYQVNCHSAGFLINSFQFSHTQPLQPPPGFNSISGGPNVTYWRRFQPRRQVWRNPSSELTLQAYVKAPWIYFNQSDPGIGQGVFFATLRDETTGRAIFVLSQFYDSRPLGVGNGNEFLGFDGVLSYSSSPLLNTAANGGALRYSTKSPYSAPMGNTAGWSSERFLRFHVSWSNLMNIASDLRSQNPMANYSLSPTDYTLEEAGILFEIFVGTANDKNFSLGASIRHFEVFEAYDY